MVDAATETRIAEQLQELHTRHATRHDDETVSFHPPEGASARALFGLAGVHVDGTRWSVGDSTVRFPLQSIAKVSTYGLVLEDHGREETLRHIGVEPSGDPFNSITFDSINNRPYNAMINAGALVAADLVRGADAEEKVARLLERLRAWTGNPALAVDEAILAAEIADGDRNVALAYLMRSLGMIRGAVDDVVTVYLSTCAVTVTADELALMGATLARGGCHPLTGERALPTRLVRDLISVMLTCGMYDAAGHWAYDVGVPAKSGVSGGIVAAVPRFAGIGVYSPGLDIYGNSVRGVAVCRELSDRYGLHVFDDPSTQRLDTATGR